MFIRKAEIGDSVRIVEHNGKKIYSELKSIRKDRIILEPPLGDPFSMRRSAIKSIAVWDPCSCGTALCSCEEYFEASLE